MTQIKLISTDKFVRRTSKQSVIIHLHCNTKEFSRMFSALQKKRSV